MDLSSPICILVFVCVFGCVYELGVPNARARGTSPTSENTRPWGFGACALFFSLSSFVSSRFSCPMRVPAALRRPQKEQFWIFGPCPLCIFLLLALLVWCAKCMCLQRCANLRKTHHCFVAAWIFYGCSLIFIDFH